uniref:Uncharacterized protein n=1 Tax=Knipowitschia caucasica TaxID=637954 RepID=A0AAV2M9F4_KNICA
MRRVIQSLQHRAAIKQESRAWWRQSGAGAAVVLNEEADSPRSARVQSIELREERMERGYHLCISFLLRYPRDRTRLDCGCDSPLGLRHFSSLFLPSEFESELYKWFVRLRIGSEAVDFSSSRAAQLELDSRTHVVTGRDLGNYNTHAPARPPARVCSAPSRAPPIYTPPSPSAPPSFWMCAGPKAVRTSSLSHTFYPPAFDPFFQRDSNKTRSQRETLHGIFVSRGH